MEHLQTSIAQRLSELSDERTALEKSLKLVNDAIARIQLIFPEGETEANSRLVEALISFFPPPPPPPPPAPPPTTFIEIPPTPPPPPAPSVFRVRVTSDIVYQLTQTFSQPFRLNDATRVFCEREKVTDGLEIQRTRSALQSMMAKLTESGRLIKLEGGRGRSQALYRKITHLPPAYKNGSPADIEVRANGHLIEEPSDMVGNV